jgi:hypothetical protein
VSSFRKAKHLKTLVSRVDAEWLSVAPAPRQISAVRGHLRAPPAGDYVGFESALERDFLIACRTEHRIGTVHAQQLVIRFTDRRTGKRRRYTPDFVITSAPGADLRWQKAVIEVKAWSDLVRSRWERRAAYAAARLWCLEQEGVHFRIVTDRQLTGPWMQNARLLSGHIDMPVSIELLERCRSLLRVRPHWIVSELLACAQQEGLNPSSVLPVIYRMVAHGELWFDRTHRVELGTLVTVGIPWGLRT